MWNYFLFFFPKIIFFEGKIRFEYYVLRPCCVQYNFQATIAFIPMFPFSTWLVSVATNHILYVQWFQAWLLLSVQFAYRQCTEICSRDGSICLPSAYVWCWLLLALDHTSVHPALQSTRSFMYTSWKFIICIQDEPIWWFNFSSIDC